MGQPAARLGDTTQHGSPLLGKCAMKTLIGNKPAWRIGDSHTCPIPNAPPPAGTGNPHGPGITTPPGAVTVLIENQPAARVGDIVNEPAANVPLPPPNPIMPPGCPTVLIGSGAGGGGGGGAGAGAGGGGKGAKGAKGTRGTGLGSATVTGHPVDVATGRVIAHGDDFELDGPVPIQFVRTYLSTEAGRAADMGFGWTHNFKERLEFLSPAHPDWPQVQSAAEAAGILADDACLRYYDANGVSALYPLLSEGGELHDPLRQRTLSLRGGVYQLQTRSGIVQRFARVSETGWILALVEVTDRNGNSNRLRYERDGVLQEVEDCYGRTLVLRYERGRVSEILLRIPGEGELSWYRYRYDAAGDLVEATDRSGASTRYSYVNHLLVQETDRDGYSFYFAYDEVYRCVRTWGRDGYLARELVYYPAARLTRVTNGEGEVILYTHNELGVVERTERGGGLFIQSTFDENGRVVLRETETGTTLQIAYNESGDATEIVDGEGNATRFDYNAFGQVTRREDAQGHCETFDYDDRGNLVAHTSHTGAVMRYEYDQHGRVVRGTTPRGRVIQKSYDRFGHETKEAENDQVTQYLYDALGNPLRRQPPAGPAYVYEWTALGFPQRLTYGDRLVAAWEYNREGSVTALTDANGRHTRYTYGPPGILVALQQYDASNGVPGALRADLKFDNDSEGCPRSIRNQHGELVRYTYDEVGRLATQVHPGNRTQRFRYDGAGRIAEIRDELDRVQRFEYDARGLPTLVEYPSGLAETFEHDELGRLTAATNAWGDIASAYDDSGRLVSERQGDFEVLIDYDDAARRIRWRLPDIDLAAEITSDEQGRLHTLDFAGVRAQFVVDEFDRLRTRTFSNGVTESLEYDACQRLATANVTRNGHTLSARRLDYDAPGRIATWNDSLLGDHRLEYDARGRLTQVLGTTAERYAYDESDNLISSHRYPQQHTATRDRLLRAGQREYEYDADGRVNRIRDAASDRAWRLLYNEQGQLTRVDLPDGGHVQYSYDSLGRRVEKQFIGGRSDGLRLLFAWKGDELVREQLWSTEDLLRERIFLHFQGEPLACLERVNGQQQVLFYHNDHRGAPLFCTDANGQIVWRSQRDSFGFDPSLTNDAQPLQLPGQYFDAETGLCYNRFRYYDPYSNRYLQPDPLATFLTPNNYTYPLDPLRFTDPLGLQDTIVLNADPGNLGCYNSQGSLVHGFGAQRSANLLDPNLNLSGVDHVVINAHGNATGIEVGRPGIFAKIRRKLFGNSFAGHSLSSMSGKELARYLKKHGLPPDCKVTVVACSTAASAGKKKNFAQSLADELGGNSEVVAWDESIIVDPKTGRPAAVWNIGDVLPGVSSTMWNTTRGQNWDTMPESYGRWTFTPGGTPRPG